MDSPAAWFASGVAPKKKTGISWTDETWNPVRIVRMSKGKPSAYDGLVSMVGGEPRWTGEVVLDPTKLGDPLRWREPRRIFVNSMSDLFHEKLSDDAIIDVFAVMALALRHTFQVLTKRARRMRSLMTTSNFGARVLGRAWEILGRVGHGSVISRPDRYKHEGIATRPWPLPNVWLGVSVENQAAADERIPDLLATPAVVRFLSCEPLLGEVDLDLPRCDDPNHGASEWDVADDDATPWCNECDSERSYGHWLHLDGGIDWVIAGCESGPGSRTCDAAWLRSLRDQCSESEVPFFLKQARGPSAENSAGPDGVVRPTINYGIGAKIKAGGVIELPYLDGVQYAEFPVARSE